MIKQYRLKLILGIILSLLGIIFLLNSIFIITGFVVMENTPNDFQNILGFIFIAIGMVLMMAKKPDLTEIINSSGLRIIASERFIKAVRGQDMTRINKALFKLTGNEERLKVDKGLHSLRAGKSERILYHKEGYQEGNGTVILDDYLSGHEYNHALSRGR